MTVPSPSIPAEIDPATSAVLRIDLGVLADNYRALSARVAPAACAAVVKADAYGLGALRVAPVLQAAGCRVFFVAQLMEALALRPVLGADAEIFVLNGLNPGAEARCAEAGITPVLNSLAQVKAWGALARSRGQTLRAALQVDSGMSRLGLPVSEQEALAAEPGLLEGVKLVLLMSHLANADEPDQPGAAEQLQAFEAARQRFPGVPASLANSAGLFLAPGYHFDLSRPGAALYGIEAGPKVEGVKLAVELHARIMQIRTVPAGTGVGYGFSHRASGPTRLATVGVGYADGWLRSLSGRGAAYFGDVRLPIIGRVSMDSFSLDVSAVPEDAIAAGDWVELIGPHQSADDVARDAGTIGYEILTSFGRRHHRHYVGM